MKTFHYKFINPEGKKIYLQKGELAHYCRTHKVAYRRMQYLISGDYMTYKGHKSLHRKAIKKLKNKAAVLYNVKTKETLNIPYPIHKNAPFHNTVISALMTGAFLQYNNWVNKKSFDLINTYA